jgi:large subunit ribosomal protein L3
VKGMRMAGHTGADRVTTRNLKVLRVDAENHLLIVEGAVPGGPRGHLVIRKAVAAKREPQPQVEKAPKGKVAKPKK